MVTIPFGVTLWSSPFGATHWSSLASDGGTVAAPHEFGLIIATREDYVFVVTSHGELRWVYSLVIERGGGGVVQTFPTR